MLRVLSDVNFDLVSDIFKAGMKQNPITFWLNDYLDSDSPDYYNEVSKVFDMLLYLQSVDAITSFEKSLDGFFKVYINPQVYKQMDILIVDEAESPPEYEKASGDNYEQK